MSPLVMVPDEADMAINPHNVIKSVGTVISIIVVGAGLLIHQVQADERQNAKILLASQEMKYFQNNVGTLADGLVQHGLIIGELKDSQKDTARDVKDISEDLDVIKELLKQIAAGSP